MKRCSKCKAQKEASEFHKNKSCSDGLQNYCKPCMIASTTRYIQSDKGKTTQRKYYTSETGKVKRRTRGKKHSQTEKGRLTNIKKCRKRYHADIEYSRLKNNSRYAGASITILKQVRERDKCCQMCFTDKDLQFDHIYPVSLGGEGTLNNLQLLCGECNSFKSNNLLLEGEGGVLVTQACNKLTFQVGEING